MRLLNKLIQRRRFEIESFNARLQMEKEAQAVTAARLKEIEISVKNDLRQK